MKFRIYRSSFDDKFIEGAHPVEMEDPFHHRCTVYQIEVNTVEDIMAIVEREGEPVIVFPADEFYGNLPSLEIYDDYRE